jgi:hypothetical protein
VTQTGSAERTLLYNELRLRDPLSIVQRTFSKGVLPNQHAGGLTPAVEGVTEHVKGLASKSMTLGGAPHLTLQDYSSCCITRGLRFEGSYLICVVCEATASHLPLRLANTSVQT